MQQKSFLGHSPLGFHKVAYTEWGQASEKPPVVCVHALTRNRHDFDKLATALQKERHIFCPDIVGRGTSDWLSDPAHYNYPQYINDMTAQIACTSSASVDWIGTSMGGIIGMFMAAQPNSPIRSLVVNDIGPFISLPALQRIGSYVGVKQEFPDLAAAELHLRERYAPFGITNDEDWNLMAENGVMKLPNGKLTLSYDTAVGNAFLAVDKPVDFWETYDKIQCPVLVMRGMESDLLSTETALEMTQRGPKAQLVEIPNVGHAPALIDLTQIQIIEKFLHSQSGPIHKSRLQKAQPFHKASQT